MILTLDMGPGEKTRLTEERGYSNNCHPTTRLEKRLVVAILLIAVVAVCLCVTLAAYYRSEFYRSQDNKPSSTCFTKECISTASSFLKSIDFEQKPCEDFYSFVCGNWIKNSYIIGEMVLSQFTRLNNIIILRIKEFLELVKPEISEHEKKVRDFYNSCINRESYEEDSIVALLEDLKEFGGWPMIEQNWDASSFNWVELIGKLYEKGYPHDILLSLGVDMDIKNTSRNMLIVNRPSLGLNDRSYYLLTKDKVMDNYMDLILHLAYYLQPNLAFYDFNITANAIRSSVVIEKYLAKSILPREHLRNPEEYYNVMTLKEIEQFAPMVPWRTLLKKLLPPDDIVDNYTRIMVVSPSTLKDLNWLLETVDNEEGKEMLANYMLYRTVLFAAEHLGKDVFSLVEDKMHHSCHRDLWQVCVGGVVDLFHMSLTATYAENYMTSETKKLLEMMFGDIQEALLNDINGANWLDKETKQKALLKVMKARSVIAYRDEILDENKLNEYYKSVKVGENHFSNMKSAFFFYSQEQMKGLNEKHIRFKWTETSNLLTANAFYQPSQNSIILPIGLLQDTFFAKGRPNYINYGSLGSILGHEYTHAFDSSGSLYDEEGNYKMWWTNQSWSNFQERTQCYIDQYNEYYEPRVKTHVNGTITLGENIADNGGVLAAYHAYTKLLERIGNEEKLPGLPFTEKQMFWISYASTWCRKQSNQSLHYMMENGVHTSAKYRVIGALSNIPEFSKDFNCKPESTLNPSSKCHLWE